MPTSPSPASPSFWAPPHRRSGRTLRTLWRALLHASENDRCHVVVVVANDSLARWTFDLLRGLAAPVHGITTVYPMLRLPNGADIRVLAARDVREHTRGLRPVIFEDHPI